MPIDVVLEIKVKEKGSFESHKHSRGPKFRPGRLHNLFLAARRVTPRELNHVLHDASRRHHTGPLGVLKTFDIHSYNFFNSKEGKVELPEVQINLYKPVKQGLGQGEAHVHCTIKLTDAFVASYQRVIVLASQGKSGKGYELDDIRFTFQKIEISYITSSVTTSDNWTA